MSEFGVFLDFIYHNFVIKKTFEVGMHLYLFVCLFPRNKMKHSNNPKPSEIWDEMVLCWEEL